MGQNPTKAASNIFCQKRKEAAKFNDRLNSREGASELIGVSPSALADYELGITKVVPVDVVIKMAEVYNAPELLSYYCHNECPLGDLCYQEPKALTGQSFSFWHRCSWGRMPVHSYLLL